MRSRGTLSLSLLPLLALLAGPARAADAVPAEELEKVKAAAPDKAPVHPAKPRKVLVYTACKGFVHDAIPIGTAALRVLGEKTGAFTIEEAAEPTALQADNLRKFDAVVFNNTTGELFEDEALKAGLLDFVRGGKGIVGIHAATDCFYKWAEFGELMGGYFDGHPWNEMVAVKLDDTKSPLNAAFEGHGFEIADEIYQFKEPYSRDRLHVLLSLDTGKTNMKKDGVKRTDGDFAVSWVRTYGKGRLFYCSLGHRHDIFWTPAVLRHYLAGILYATGDLAADATPSNQLEQDGWAKLCNGKDLTGWIAKPGSWVVENGELLRKAGGSYIWTEQVYRDFVLECDFKLDKESNSGIFFRTTNIDDPVQTGIEMQVYDTAGKTPPAKNDCGAIYDCVAPTKNTVKPPGEWNHVVLSVRGNSIRVVLNGEPIVDMDLAKWTAAGKNPDGTSNKFKAAYKDMVQPGRIGFQDHEKPVWYRNIRIQRLDD
jgi:type 1 glutamine amidotransferase